MLPDLLIEVSYPVLVVTLIAVLLSLLFLYKRLFYPSKSSSRNVLIAGPVGAGKTALFYRITENAFVETVSSMSENACEAPISGRKFRLIDYPGHPRLRPELQRLLSRSSMRAVVVVVDGAERVRVKEAAEIIADLFAQENFRSPIVIAVSKSDSADFRAPGVVAAEIEREIDAIRKSREADGVFIGVAGENFKLAKHSPVAVRLCAFSAKNDDLKALIAALSKAAGISN